MARKRKAQRDAEDEEYAQQHQPIHNHNIQRIHFQDFSDSGMKNRTVVTGRISTGNILSPGTNLTDNSLDARNDLDVKKSSQVSDS